VTPDATMIYLLLERQHAHATIPDFIFFISLLQIYHHIKIVCNLEIMISSTVFLVYCSVIVHLFQMHRRVSEGSKCHIRLITRQGCYNYICSMSPGRLICVPVRLRWLVCLIEFYVTSIQQGHAEYQQSCI